MHKSNTAENIRSIHESIYNQSRKKIKQFLQQVENNSMFRLTVENQIILEHLITLEYLQSRISEDKIIMKCIIYTAKQYFKCTGENMSLCSNCDEETSKYDCSCFLVRYCSKECQDNHWLKHKSKCFLSKKHSV